MHLVPALEVFGNLNLVFHNNLRILQHFPGKDHIKRRAHGAVALLHRLLANHRPHNSPPHHLARGGHVVICHNADFSSFVFHGPANVIYARRHHEKSVHSGVSCKHCRVAR